MLSTPDLNQYLSSLLMPSPIKDYCPNGLQISGKSNITRVATAVTANLYTIQAAIEAKADALLVHHGVFWQRDEFTLVGPRRERIKAILAHDLNLFSYHLPLDVHPIYGNNAQLSKALGLQDIKQYPLFDTPGLLWIGSYPTPVTVDTAVAQVTKVLDRKPLAIVPTHLKTVQKIALCTGAAQDGIASAHHYGADLFISGEIALRTVDIAREWGIAYFAAGHYATEVFGVKVLGAHLAEKFGLEVTFIPEDNPV